MVELYTVGHSTRGLDEFVGLLREHAVRAVADVRRFPASKRHPHFARESLAGELHARGIDYHHIARLGGLRGDYLEYTKDPEFREGVKELLWIAVEKTTAVMCAELVPEKCHRRFLSDVLVKRGVSVRHIIAPGVLREHAPPQERPLEEYA